MHPCLADRFLTPRLVETFKLLASDDSPIGDEAFKVASQGLEIGLLEDPEEVSMVVRTGGRKEDTFGQL